MVFSLSKDEVYFSTKKAYSLLRPTIDQINLLVEDNNKNFIKEQISLFGGIYLGLVKKISDSNVNKYISAKIASQRISKESNFNSLINISNNTNLDLLLSSINPLTKKNKVTIKDFQNHFQKLNGTLDKILENNNLKDFECEIEGVKYTTKNNPTKNNQIKELEEFHFEPVLKEDIIGKEHILNQLESVANQILHYSTTEKINLFDFPQYILLKGIPGTGKTLRAKYFLSYIKERANQNDIPLKISKLEFEDRWQNGPLENIKKQFEEISSGNKINAIFIDELDLKFPRRGNATHSQEQTLGEFLRFRGGVYPNHKNYVFISTTNKEENIDNALLDVFQKYEISPPKSFEEKKDILLKNLEQFNTNNICWEKLEDILQNRNITGRNLYNTSLKIKEQFGSIAKEIPLNKTISEKRNILEKLLSSSKYLIDENTIYKALIKEEVV